MLILPALSLPTNPALAGALIGVTGTLLTTLVTGFLGRGKFMREKLWEKRQDACNTIVSELRAGEPFGERISEGFDEDAYGYYQSNLLQRTHEQYLLHMNAAHESFQKNYLILPGAFRRRYERMLKDRRAWWDAADPDAYLGPIGVNGVAARALMDIAVVALGITPFLPRQYLRVRRVVRSVPRLVQQPVRWFKRKKRQWRNRHDEDVV